MTAVDPTAARFLALADGAGHYESFYLKACHPSLPLGVWIRYTVHVRPGEAPTGSLWLTLFEESPTARKVTLPEPSVEAGEWIRVGGARLGDGFARGEAEDASWDLRFSSSEPVLLHLPRDWMYTARLPRTKLLSPAPAALFSGTVSIGDRVVPLEGWRGMVGHNWGAQHAERWIWLHGISEDGDWIDAAIGRVKLGPALTPWIAGGAVGAGAERLAVGGLRRRATVAATPTGCRFVLPGPGGVRVEGDVSAAAGAFVGWVYADPDGGEHHTVNCSVADMRARLERPGRSAVELTVEGGAAYELGMRERDHGMEIQPYPDG